MRHHAYLFTLAALASAVALACGGSSTSESAGTDAGSGASSSTGGTHSGTGGGTLTEDAGVTCPADFITAEGTACSLDGKVCGGACSPCSPCSTLVCSAGKWQRFEAYPDPAACVDGGSDAGDECPTDPLSDEGTPCSQEGKLCAGQCDDPCSFCSGAQCQNGKWTFFEAAPHPDCADAGPTLCGGKQGLSCDPSDYCDFAGHCGATDQSGSCAPRPQGCTADCPGVCGCDGKFYCNACSAAAQGVDVSDDKSCIPAEDAGAPG